MTTLQKLGVAGFRSYNPDEMQFITFYKPLTLICGENGSGKTVRTCHMQTIIECLRLITTGKTPPNTANGKTFVTDPILTGKNESIGTTKLQFTNPTGRKFIASKSVQLAKVTKKGQTKQEYKSLEQSIKTRDQRTNQLITINNHCTDVEKQLPNIFGVTPAVMEYVIFCHQEQSLWPFAASNTLKNLFDQLFNTSAFTTFYEIMKENLKELQKNLRETQIKIQGLASVQKEQDKNSIMVLEIKKTAAESSMKIPPLRQKLRFLIGGPGGEEELRKQYDKIIYKKAQLQHKIKEYVQKMQLDDNYLRNLQKLSFEDLEREQQNCLNKLDRLQGETEQLEIKLTKSKNDYMALHNTEHQPQSVNMFDLEVIRIKESIPEILEEENSCTGLLRKLERQRMEIESAEKELKSSQSALMTIPTVMPDSDYGELHQLMADLINRKEQCKLQEQQVIRKCQLMYGKVERQEMSKRDPSSRIEYMLKHLKDTEDQLRALSNVEQPIENRVSKAEITNKIQKLQLAGIDLQKQFMEYCQKNKKCHFCLRAISDHEMTVIEQSFEKRQEKAKNMIDRLQQQLKTAVDNNQQEKQTRIMNLQSQIRKIRTAIKQLEEQRVKFQEQQRAAIQIATNQQIEMFLANFNIKIDPSKNYIDRINQPEDLEKLKTQIKEYSRKAKEVQEDQRKIQIMQRRNEEKKKSNEVEHSNNQKRRQELMTRCKSLSNKVSKKPFVLSHISMLKQIEQNNLNVQVNNKSDDICPPPANAKQKTIQCYNRYLEAQKQFAECKRLHDCTSAKLQQLHQCATIKEIMKQITQNEQQLKAISMDIERCRKEIEEVQSQCTRFITLASDRDVEHQPKDAETEAHMMRYQCQFEVDKLICQEMEKRMKILDYTLITFHKEKMEEINRLLKETWEDVYHGQDIKYVQIRTTEELTAKQKTYNYHVSMVLQNGSEIEMRGRCSTGQKVLASIIIRLVLAEFFDGRCSVLALDEPTTNLDTEHIQKLANQLGRLIASRKDRNAFQLIVISHDMHFIGLLRQYADMYYEVRRVNRFSIVKEKQIALLK